MDAHEIKQITAKYFTDKLFAVHYEVGLNKGGALRADILATNMRSFVVVVEVKSSVGDFKADKKWEKYLEFCNQFYFAMPHAVWAKVKHLIPKSVGVFVIHDGARCASLEGRSTKRPINPEVLLNVITRMAYRSANTTRHSRKSKTSGAKLVAKTAVAALVEARMTKAPKKATRIITKAIEIYV